MSRKSIEEAVMSTKTELAVVPTDDSRAVEVSRTVDAAPVSLTSAIGGLLDGLKNTLSNMDDVNIEVSAHSDKDRSSAHFKLRGYRHRDA
jgi:hypothetical protein